MSDTTILYAGIFCFGCIILGVVLTIVEFRQMERRRSEDTSGARRNPQGVLAVDSVPRR